MSAFRQPIAFPLLIIIFVFLLNSGNRGTLPIASAADDYSGADFWEEKSMFCICMSELCGKRYYGIIFDTGKTKTLHIRKGALQLPEDSSSSDYTLLIIYGAKKIFWKNFEGVNSLDRNNFVHLLNGHKHGACKPYSTLTLFEKLQERIDIEKDEDSGRTILDELR